MGIYLYMINEEKVIIMTRLAMYDKKYGEADKGANSFFRHDYVYWKNFWNRFYALIGCFIIIAIYAFNKIVVNAVDLFEIDYRAEGIRALVFIAAVMLICSTISSIKSTREYSAVQKRLEVQLELTEKLEGKGDKTHSHGANINHKRRRG